MEYHALWQVMILIVLGLFLLINLIDYSTGFCGDEQQVHWFDAEGSYYGCLSGQQQASTSGERFSEERTGRGYCESSFLTESDRSSTGKSEAHQEWIG